jgi:hypothetical protein
VKIDPRQIEVVDDGVAAVLRTKTHAERLDIAFNIWISTHEMLMSHLRETHPNWFPKEVKHEAARRLLHGAL